MATALVPLADGFEEIEAVAIIDVLRRGGVAVTTAHIGQSDCVRGAHGMALKADAPFGEAAERQYDAIVLPGGGEGTANLAKCEALADRLHRQKEEGGLLCAICAAPTVLVDAGVADPGLHMTCYPSMMMELDRPYSNVPVVADGDLITGQGPGTATLFAIVVLQALAGEAVARRVAREMVANEALENLS